MTEPTLQSEKLKPCRFCGGKSMIEEFRDGDDPQPLFVATCKVCPVKTYDQFTAQEAARIWNSRAPIVAPQGENGEQLPDSRGNYTDGFRDGWKAHFDASPASSLVPHSAGFDDAARVSRVLNQVAATPTPVEQEQNYDLDPLEFWCDLAEVLGHPRPEKADVPALVSEVKECLAPSPSVRAAKDIREWIGISGMVDGEGLNEVAAIIERHCSPVSAAPASPSPAEPGCVCDHVEHKDTGECLTCGLFCGPVSNEVGQNHLLAWKGESDDGSAEWCDDCHGHTHRYDCPALRTSVGEEVNKASSQLNIENEAAKASFVAWWATMEAQGYQYGFEALCNVWVGFDDGRKVLAKELIAAAETEERSRFGDGATGVSSALRDKCKELGVEID